MKKRYIASVSFGKDSLAMLLLLIDKGYPLDEVVFYDTGKEFQAIYDIRDSILPLLESKGIRYTELKPRRTFDYSMFERPVRKRGTNQIHKYGYGWCGASCRWGTSQKRDAMKKHAPDAITYVGIAADESQRIKHQSETKQYPLVEWNMTESDCLQFCYSKGFFWIENGIRLYDILSRVSCWCCRNKNLKELENIYHYLPHYWVKLKNIQSRISDPMKGKGKSVFELENRFNKETDMKQRHYKITAKERTTGHIVTPEYVGNKTREEVIQFFGLREPDIEWFKIEEVTPE